MGLKLLNTCLLAALLVLPVSCRNDDSDPDPTVTFTDMATLVSNSESEGIVFAISAEGDSPEVSVAFPGQTLDSSVAQPGRRYLIRYTVDGNRPYTTGTGRLLGINAAHNGLVDDDTDAAALFAASSPQTLVSVWRTGDWINLEALCTYVSGAPAVYNIVADTESLGTSHPDMYLVYTPDNIEDGATTRTLYSSFNIGSLWNNPSFSGLTLHIKTADGVRAYVFNR